MKIIDMAIFYFVRDYERCELGTCTCAFYCTFAVAQTELKFIVSCAGCAFCVCPPVKLIITEKLLPRKNAFS